MSRLLKTWCGQGEIGLDTLGGARLQVEGWSWRRTVDQESVPVGWSLGEEDVTERSDSSRGGVDSGGDFGRSGLRWWRGRLHGIAATGGWACGVCWEWLGRQRGGKGGRAHVPFSWGIYGSSIRNARASAASYLGYLPGGLGSGCGRANLQCIFLCSSGSFVDQVLDGFGGWGELRSLLRGS